jgi:hypothetical protein
MLVLLMKNRSLFHTALSLANWLYAVILDSADDEGVHGLCKAANSTELSVQQDISIQALQEDIKCLNERGVENAFKESVACLQSIIQLLEFEVAMAGNTASWSVHHDAAVVLFEQIIAHHATGKATDGSETTPWLSILDRVSYPFRRIPLGRGRQILTSDQSALRFYTAHLLWLDVLAATATGTAPRLTKYHAELLEGEPPTIRLGEYVGCHSWATLSIAEVASLATWKRTQTASGSLSNLELVQRACGIEKRLRSKMATLLSSSSSASSTNNNIYDPSAYPPVTPYLGFQEMTGQLSGLESGPTSAAMALHTRIWAQATITYLNIITSGLQPSLPEIRASVDTTIELLKTLPSPLALRTLVWPFAVTGCCALPEQEALFVGLVEAMGAMAVFGTIREALRIMQNVWEHMKSGCVEPQMWDIATCFSLLGHPPLLV